jgi:hypothetical protein
MSPSVDPRVANGWVEDSSDVEEREILDVDGDRYVI